MIRPLICYHRHKQRLSWQSCCIKSNFEQDQALWIQLCRGQKIMLFILKPNRHITVPITKNELGGSLKHATDELEFGLVTVEGLASKVSRDPAGQDRLLSLCSLALFTSLNLVPISDILPSSIMTTVPLSRQIKRTIKEYGTCAWSIISICLTRERTKNIADSVCSLINCSLLITFSEELHGEKK